MGNVAIPFSDLASGEKAVGEVLRAVPPEGVELVAMVEPLRPGKVAVFQSEAAVRAQAATAAMRWLAVLGAALDRAHVPHEDRIAFGPSTATLRALAERRDLVRIVVALPAEAPWTSSWRHVALRSAASSVTVL